MLYIKYILNNSNSALRYEWFKIRAVNQMYFIYLFCFDLQVQTLDTSAWWQWKIELINIFPERVFKLFIAATLS